LNMGYLSSDIINVFSERNYKESRDAFWWTHRRVDFSVFPYVTLRFNPKYAFMAEFGNQDIGFPVSASRTLNLGLSTEVFKFFLTVPAAYPHLGSGQPLDGAYGGALKFDSPHLGGSIYYQDMKFVGKGDITPYDKNNIIFNNYSGLIYWSFTSRIGKSKENMTGKFGLPLGSLRTKFGATLLSYVYGYENDNGSFIERSRTEKLSLLQAYVRSEFATDRDEKNINRWRIMGQMNLGLTGFGSGQVGLTFTHKEWLSYTLLTAFFWKDMNIEWLPSTPGDDQIQSYTWKPGFYVIPTVSIYF
jgi:hypothetical protein